jgi:hypothetical protein
MKVLFLAAAAYLVYLFFGLNVLVFFSFMFIVLSIMCSTPEKYEDYRKQEPKFIDLVKKAYGLDDNMRYKKD